MAFTLALAFPNSRWLFLRESLPTLKRTLLNTFNNVLLQGFDAYVKHYDGQMMVYTLHNGSQFIFMAESFDTDKELNRFRGLEINGAFIDEVNELHEETFDKVIERAGSWFHSPGCPIKILCTANPSHNWLKKRIYDKWKNGTLPKGVAYIPARIFDNPHIPAEYLESLKMLPLYQYKVFVEGDWDVQLKTGGEFYKAFELDAHVRETFYDPALPLHISFDDNVNPYLPCGIFQIHIFRDADGAILRHELHMIDEVPSRTPNNTVSAICREITRRYQGHRAGMFIYGDATAQKEDTKLEKGYNFFRLIVEALKEFKPQLRMPASNPSVVMRGMWVNMVFEKNIGNLWFVIGRNCVTAINDFILLKEAADGTKNKEMETDPKTKVRYQKHGHFTDLFDYLVCTAFGAEFMAYQKGGTALRVSTGGNRSKNSY